MYVNNNERPPAPGGGTLLIEESPPSSSISQRKLLQKVMIGIMISIILFPLIGSSIDLLSRISSSKDMTNKKGCDSVYLTSMYLEKCNDVLFLVDILKNPSSFTIRLNNRTSVYNFLHYCLDYTTNYTIKFYYYPHMLIIKDKKGLKSFYINNYSIPTIDLIKMVHFIEK